MTDIDDYDTLYSTYSGIVPPNKTLIAQGLHRLSNTDSLFYSAVTTSSGQVLKALVDSGSMACTISETVDEMLSQSIPDIERRSAEDIVIVGCGGHLVTPSAMYDLTVSIYGFKVVIPVLVVPGQADDMILGSNAIKWLISQLRMTVGTQDDAFPHLATLLSYSDDCSGRAMPPSFGTAKLKRRVTLQPLSEHLVWAKLPAPDASAVGSAVIVEPTQSRSKPAQILVGRVVTSLFGDGWVPVKVVNPSDKPLTLRRNAKIADVSPCLSVQDLPEPVQIQSSTQYTQNSSPAPRSEVEMSQRLCDLGLQDLDLSSCEVSPEWRDRLLRLIEQYESIFSRHKMDCGEAADFVHRIRLVDDKPFRLPYRRVPPCHYEKFRTALDEMEESGIIRKSQSEFSSPLVLVVKPNGDLRICNDFRWLNARTVKDAHPLPHQSDALAALGGNVFFSTMDLTSGFYNVRLHEDDKKYTAFSSPFGLHEYNRMPQGLTNSPATFMRMMMSIFGDENFTSLLCYLDDLMVYARSEQVALERLQIVFSRLSANNLKLSPKKCHFLQRSVKFLGHIICGEGVKTDPSKVQAIDNVQEADLMESDGVTPCARKIRSFLGMVLYYHHFIERCSAKAKPLFDLVAEPAALRKRGRGHKPKFKRGHVKLSPAGWTDECREAFKALKHELVHSVTLAHPDFTAPFILAVDASFDGLGAVLSQLPPDGRIARPVAFASKTLPHSQLNYPAHSLEFLALKWAVCDKFSHWLKGSHFTVWTDNNPLTYILTKPRLDACEQQWVSKLAAYSFELKYVPGTKNVVADALSREPFVQSCIGHRLVTEPYAALLNQMHGLVDGTVQDVFRCVANCQLVVDQSEEEATTILANPQGSLLSQDVSAVLAAHDTGGISHVRGVGPDIPQLPTIARPACTPRSELANLQEQDEVLGRVFFYVRCHKRPTRHERAGESRGVMKLLRHWSRLMIKDSMLYKVKKDRNMNMTIYQFVVPDALKTEVLRGIHDMAGHQGQVRTLSLARQRFFWTGMEHDIINHVKSCFRCVVGKTPEPNDRATLESICTTEPMELVCIDFWTAEQTDKKCVDVLVVTDHFSKLAHAFPCKNQSAKQVTRRLWNDFFRVYGFPRLIHSDQGANFESQLIKELLDMAGIQKSHTTPYHPMGNGIVERYNRTLGNMIRALPPQSKARWPQMLQMLTFCYNCTEHETTGFAPFFLIFGRIPRLPVDVVFQHVLPDGAVVDHSEFVAHLKRDLSEAARIARQNSRIAQAQQAKNYDRKAKGAPLSVGDRVLLANRGERGKRKIADKWESTVFEVASVKPDINVYHIRDPVSLREKVVHRNLLLPVSFLPAGNECLPVLTCPSVADSGQGEPELPGDVQDGETKTVRWLMQMDQASDRDSAVGQTGCSLDAALSIPNSEAESTVAPPAVCDLVVSQLPSPAPSVECVVSRSASSQLLAEDAQHVLSPDLVTDTRLSTEGHVARTQPPPLCTRSGRPVKPPTRLICEMNEQHVDDSVSTVDSLFSFVRNMFSG
ncbi:calcium/calmodulin-dependent serine protein kinase [Sarotherodon galilaeus]